MALDDSILPTDPNGRVGLYDDVNDRTVAPRARHTTQAGSGRWYGDTAISYSALAGYVAPYGSNPVQTAASGADTLFKWGTAGTQQVNHILLQNNTGAALSFELDAATTGGSPILPTGQTLLLDVEATVLHLSSAAQQNINGTTSGNIVVRAWL